MDQKSYPAEKVRGGEIILNTPLRRTIFLSGLIGASSPCHDFDDAPLIPALSASGNIGTIIPFRCLPRYCFGEVT
jgi:hypothetical protein